MKEQATSMKS